MTPPRLVLQTAHEGFEETVQAVKNKTEQNRAEQSKIIYYYFANLFLYFFFSFFSGGGEKGRIMEGRFD